DRAEHKRGAPERPAHQPHPELKPADAMQHLHLAHTAAQAARDNGTPPPAPRPRPAGAGRYVAAVITCPDADLDVPTLLGVARAEILWISKPGPFTSTETVPLSGQLTYNERLSLVVLLGHDECSTRSLGERTAAQRSLSNRLAVLRHNTGLQAAATRGFLLAQREALLAS